jgi:hypothetical protein
MEWHGEMDCNAWAWQKYMLYVLVINSQKVENYEKNQLRRVTGVN